jgi:hypothetical protein
MASKESVTARFFTAIITGDIATVKEIIPAHADFLSWVSPAGYPPLHMAILNRREDIAVCLAEHGADMDQVALGATAASIADRKGMIDALRAAAARKDAVRTEAIDACGENMRQGLPQPISVSRRPLKLKR